MGSSTSVEEPIPQEPIPVTVRPPPPPQPKPIPKFDPTQNKNWNDYLQKLEDWFQHSNVSNPDEKRILLMDALTPSALQRLKDILYPEMPQKKTYQQLCIVINRSFGQPLSIIHERKRFYFATQGFNEPVRQWDSRLERLAQTCHFDFALQSPILLDKFVTGLIDGRIIKRLAEEDISTMSITKAVTIAHNYEVKYGMAGPKKTENTNNRSSAAETSSSGAPKCKHCGHFNHASEVCYKNAVCDICKKRGHIAQSCRNRNRQNQNGDRIN